LVLLLAVVDEFLKKHGFVYGKLEGPEDTSPERISGRQRSATPVMPSPLRTQIDQGFIASRRTEMHNAPRYETPSPSRQIPPTTPVPRLPPAKRSTAIMDESTLITSSGPIKRRKLDSNAMAKGGELLPEDEDGCEWLRELLAVGTF